MHQKDEWMVGIAQLVEQRTENPHANLTRASEFDNCQILTGDRNNIIIILKMQYLRKYKAKKNKEIYQ